MNTIVARFYIWSCTSLALLCVSVGGSATSGSPESCPLSSLPQAPLLAYSLGGRPLPPKMMTHLTVPEGGSVKIRCRHVGLYKQNGGDTVNCTSEGWSGNVTCSDTNHASNYTSGTQPPAIVWQVAGGGVSVIAEGGQLVLLPGSIIHLDCLYPRLAGNPTWTWTPEYRKYPTGWSISSSERDLHYRLSVYYAKHYDSGSFTCTSPTGNSNSITIIIKELKCPDLEVPHSVAASQLDPLVFGQRELQGDNRVIVAGTGTTMGSSRFFACFEGYSLDGPEQMSCLPSGLWSSVAPPACKIVRCPPLPALPPMVRLRHLSVTAGGVAVFACPQSYALTAEPSIKCLTNGTWSAPIPHCEEILCPMPDSPDHGSVSTGALRRVGDIAIYSCDQSYVLNGPRQVTCTSSGTWSKSTPECVVSCKSPGKPRHGRVSPRLLRYHLGAQLLVSCSPGYRPAGPDRLQCLKTGRWSAPLPPCVVVIAG